MSKCLDLVQSMTMPTTAGEANDFAPAGTDRFGVRGTLAGKLVAACFRACYDNPI